jgi:tetratricopeptide (TPR) repeat protein
MRTLLAVFTVWFVVAVSVQWGHDSSQLREARRLLAGKQYVEASARAEQVLDSGFTGGLRRAAHVLLHDICKQAGDQAREEHQYGEAREWFKRILDNPGNPSLTGYEWIAEKRLQVLADEHMDYAKKLESSGQLAEALAEYGKIRREWPDNVEVLGLARAEAGCRKAYVDKIIPEIPEEALKELAALVNAPDAPAEVIEEGFARVVGAAHAAVGRFKQRRQYPQAFACLDEACKSFGARPDIVDELSALASQLETDLFGEDIKGRQLTELQFDYAGPGDKENDEDRDMVNLSLYNGTTCPGKAMLRGPARVEKTIAPGGTETLRFPSGDYVFALVGPPMIPIRSTLHLEPGQYNWGWGLSGRSVVTFPRPDSAPVPLP